MPGQVPRGRAWAARLPRKAQLTMQRLVPTKLRNRRAAGRASPVRTPGFAARKSWYVESARTTGAAAGELPADEIAPAARAGASAAMSGAAVTIYAGVLGYGGRLWLEMSHPASGITHTPARVVSWWLKGATVVLPATLAVVWGIAAVANRRAQVPARGWFGGAAVWLAAGPLAVAAVTALLLPVQLWLMPELHAHGELPSPSYEFGSFLELLRADVLLAIAIVLIRSIGRSVVHPVVFDEQNRTARSS
jgi:hypothetical protein